MDLNRMLRAVCAGCIAIGAVMHAAGLWMARASSFSPPWWMLLIFWTAILGYAASSAGILLRFRPAILFAVIGPLTGGVLIFLGLLVPGLDLQLLIPGTLQDEIRPIGFVTLVAEPVAVFSGILLLMSPVEHAP